MKKKILTITAVVAATLTLTGCFESINTVDTKLELPVPDSKVPCYMLEIDRKNGAGEDEGELFLCVTKAEYEKNQVGEEWVGADGKKR